MQFLEREDILRCEDLKIEVVEVPEWGGAVRVRGLRGTERDDFEASHLVKRNGKHEVVLHDMRAKLCARAIVDEAGIRIFSDDDIEALGMKSAAALTRVYQVAARLSGLTDEAVDEALKNSGGDRSADSGSGSPSR